MVRKTSFLEERIFIKKLELMSCISALLLLLSLGTSDNLEEDAANDVYYVDDYSNFTLALSLEDALSTLYQDYLHTLMDLEGISSDIGLVGSVK